MHDLAECATGFGVACVGAAGPWYGIFKQHDHVQKRRALGVATEDVTATDTADRTDQPGPTECMHDLGQMMGGDAVFFADFVHGYLPGRIFGQFYQGVNCQTAGNLQIQYPSLRICHRRLSGSQADARAFALAISLDVSNFALFYNSHALLMTNLFYVKSISSWI